MIKENRNFQFGNANNSWNLFL